MSSWFSPGPAYANPFAGRSLSNLGSSIAEDNPESVLELLVSQLSAPSGMKSWLRGRQANWYNQYKGESIDPERGEDWFTWLSRRNLGQLYGNASFQERGERPGNFMLGTRLIR